MNIKDIIKNYDEKRRLSHVRAEVSKRNYRFEEVSILSSDCIGGILYHDLGLKFLSPTINLSFKDCGFYYFILNLKHYVSSEISFVLDNGNIIGKIEGNSLLENCPNIFINFVHYNSIDEATKSWNTRKLRINYDKIRVIVTERNLSIEKLELFNKINFRKVMIYGNFENGIVIPNNSEFIFSKMIKSSNYRGELLTFKGIGHKRHFDDLNFDFLAFLQ